ncbi:hypothetical protein TRFO_05230 [Tritrichomonas foetus]|uniref:Uncharacterized protein n=1 Tax=Tritrichomonas foetus TaxID=1144522 RepID=A0A1J4K9J0_9EUKA|nr:hypothetical protein TRFO_05230 [Tritrichomonas foetus]|eukprot:OHT07576.1 hypothetical protein TRFO_05230 [Tritrichomonas foetus]
MNYKSPPKIEPRIEQFTQEVRNSMPFSFMVSKSTKQRPLNNQEEMQLRSAFGFIFSQGDELIQMGIETLKDLMINNFHAVDMNSIFNQRRNQLPNRLLTLLNTQKFTDDILELLDVLLANSSEFDRMFENELPTCLNNIISSTSDFNLIIYSIIRYIVSRNHIFRHNLFEIHFYDTLPTSYVEADTDTQEMIATVLLKTVQGPGSMTPMESIIILNMLEMLLTTENSNIVKCGLDILSRLSLEINDVLSILEDGKVIYNLCQSLESGDIELVICVIKYLSRFANIGETIISQISENEGLQKISRIFDPQNKKMIILTFNLLANWLTLSKDNLNDPFQFLMVINLRFILENGDFDILKVVLHVVRLASVRFVQSEIYILISPGLLSTLVSKFKDADDPEINYELCVIFETMLSNSTDLVIHQELQNILRDDDLYNKLNDLAIGDDKITAEMATSILSFIQKNISEK